MCLSEGFSSITLMYSWHSLTLSHPSWGLESPCTLWSRVWTQTLLFRAKLNTVSPFLLSLSGCWWYRGKLLQGYPPLSGPSSPATAWVGPALAWSRITNLHLTSTGRNLEGSCTQRCTSFGMCNCTQCLYTELSWVQTNFTELQTTN